MQVTVSLVGAGICASLLSAGREVGPTAIVPGLNPSCETVITGIGASFSTTVAVRALISAFSSTTR